MVLGLVPGAAAYYRDSKVSQPLTLGAASCVASQVLYHAESCSAKDRVSSTSAF